MSCEIIILDNVFFSYPGEKNKALNGISLSVKQGELLAVMGENGSGKTTFCKLLNGIIPHLTGGKLSGTILIDGEKSEASSVSRLAQKTAFVFDDPDAQLFTSSVRSEAAFGPENLLLPPEEIKKRIEESLCAVGLAGFENRQPSTLSGGEKQRLAIAVALAMKGKILVLDDPLCRLDPDGANEVMSVLKNIRKNFNLTVIMVSHDSARMFDFADRVCILNKGRIIACDTSEKIFADRVLLEENGIYVGSGEWGVGSRAPEHARCQTVLMNDPSRRSAKEVLQDEKMREGFNLSSALGGGRSAINIFNVCFKYEQSGFCLKKFNLFILDNEFIAIVGKNGSGKTTLLKIITGLLRPWDGDVFIRDKNAKMLCVSDISKDIGFVMQNPDNQLFTDTVWNEIAFSLKNAGLSKKEISVRVEDAMKTVGLTEPDAFPHALSRADRTKVVIACVLAMGSKIIIFDEADAGQDYKDSLMIMNIAKDLHCKGYTIIFVTHNMPLVYEYAHRLIIMDKNGIVTDKLL